MKTLHISVFDKIANYRKRDGFIVCGNSDYQIAFTFDEDWGSYDKKTARFIYGGTYTDIVFSGVLCPVPIIRNAPSVSVGVFAGDLYTTTPAKIECRKSILCDNGTPEAPSEDVYAQIMELLNAGGAGITPEQAAQIEENRKRIESISATIPTDAHITELIGSALGRIENGTY